MSKPKKPAPKPDTAPAKARTTKPRAPRGPSAVTPRKGVELMTDLDYYRSMVLRLEAAMSQADPATIAYVQLSKAQMDARGKVDLILAGEKADPWAGLSEDEVRQKLREMAEDMPTDHLAIFASEYCNRMAIPFPLRVAT